MANKNETVVVRGKLNYAKILGDPVLNYSKDGKEWKTDLIVNDAVKKEMKQYGIADRVRTKDGYVDGQPFMSFKQKELQASGKANKPIEVVDIRGNPWPQDVLIGNGSDADVKFAVVDFGAGKAKGVYPRKIRILKLVPYAKDDMPDIADDDEFRDEFEAAVEGAAIVQDDAPVDDLDDEVF